jgi:hypothetical protein
MRYSLWTLMFVVTFAPPLAVKGWRLLDAVLTPELELVYPCGHGVHEVSWEDAKRGNSLAV